jgi:hypothetical protein
MKNKKIIYGLSAMVILFFLLYSTVTVFVIPPIGAIPEGKTLVISKLNKTNFIDSADAMCERISGGVSLLCRGMAMGAVLEKSTIYMRLPYVHSLYLISTNGATYEN